MFTNERAPKWWRLYALLALMIGLLFLEIRTRLGPGEHKLVETGIVLGGYGLVWLWLSANRLVTTAKVPRDDPDEADSPGSAREK